MPDLPTLCNYGKTRMQTHFRHKFQTSPLTMAQCLQQNLSIGKIMPPGSLTSFSTNDLTQFQRAQVYG